MLYGDILHPLNVNDVVDMSVLVDEVFCYFDGFGKDGGDGHNVPDFIGETKRESRQLLRLVCDSHEVFLYLNRDKTIDIGKYCKTLTLANIVKQKPP